MEKTNIAYKILANPVIYRTFQRFVGGKQPKIYQILEKICQDFLILRGRKPTLLDLGCGEGNLCHWISSYSNYYGVDYSEEYLAHAKNLYGTKGEFISLDFCSSKFDQLPNSLDIIVGIGLIHHLADEDIKKIQDNIINHHKNAIILTIDPVLLDRQHRIAKFMVSKDRGAFVRTLSQYQLLMPDYDYHLDNFCKIPYNHVLFYRNIDLNRYL
ncbi:class I SAM-dependent methyltransferase [Legionella hackeliae]|uniref:Methyltransferase domain-containing protein n=1 Tax=Legionella hackeliae TaxID=449 RepID=A0A0A8UMZ7_LEGHA|nr:class I SAM-dependent methyltransferase [Legionella hackeliae]KTD08822.1 Mg-protoporphyrin IX methyl transferase [Legionella hackeliae]CEK10250.1 protein of unknown function [Legionella hackeliae]STX46979.1 Mg-protoporphyrin IX methyl transferase [Legionella hackeliae]